VTQRVEEILTLRQASAAFVEIRQYAAEKGWGVSERQLWRYIEHSDDLLAKTLEPSREKRINLALAQRRLLHNRALETGDYRTALAVLDSLAKLQDLYPSAKREPLDVLLSYLPPVLAAAIRAELAGLLSGGASAESGGGPGDGPAGSDPPRPEPDPHPRRDDPGPVADGPPALDL
jgi:hypothetical protein